MTLGFYEMCWVLGIFCVPMAAVVLVSNIIRRLGNKEEETQ